MYTVTITARPLSHLYRVSINPFPDYKHLLQENFTLHLRRVSAVHNFPRCYTSTLGFTCSLVFECYISKQVEWERWSDSLATTIAGYRPIGFLLWEYVKKKLFSTPIPYITNLKARITDAFATVTEDVLENTWREIDYRLDVLRITKRAHVEVY